jgi:CRISPR-associated protein Csd2
MSIQNRYEFILYFEVINGNPNGDPDAGNLPRIDPDTGRGLVSDVCLKRKIRNYVELVKSGSDSHRIYVTEGAVLNNKHQEAYDAVGKKPEGSKKPAPKEVTEWLCAHFYDVRTFGAVMSTEINGGTVRGPVQLCFSKSEDPIVPQEISITRMAVTNKKDLDKERTMGRKSIVPYGLYRLEGFISAPQSLKTGFSEDDLQLFWNALINMFDHDRSAARGRMASRKLYVFRHDSSLGNAPASALFDLVKAQRVNPDEPVTRRFEDYSITVQDPPAGVSLLELL